MATTTCLRPGLFTAPLLTTVWLTSGLAPLRAHAAIKVACVGDSITVGVAASAPNRYPTLLAQRLGTGYQVQNFGLSGSTLLRKGNLPYWNSVPFVAADAFAPNIVLIMLGTNDSKPANWAMSAAFAGDYKALIEHYRALPSHPTVYALLPPPAFGTNPYMIRGPIIEQEVVPATQAIAVDTATPTIDVFGALRNAKQDFPDNVHPNDAGNVKIATAVYRALSTSPGDAGADSDARSDANDARASDATSDLARETSFPETAADAERETGDASVDLATEARTTSDTFLPRDNAPAGGGNGPVTQPPAAPQTSAACSMIRHRQGQSPANAVFVVGTALMGLAIRRGSHSLGAREQGTFDKS